jgi:hypothetical protein
MISVGWLVFWLIVFFLVGCAFGWGTKGLYDKWQQDREEHVCTSACSHIDGNPWSH